jgi:hypothetical protein
MKGKFVCSIVKALFSEFWQPMNVADIALIIRDEGDLSIMYITSSFRKS